MGQSFLRRTVDRTLGSARKAFSHAPLRLKILLALLAVVIAGAAVWTVRTWCFEIQLVSVMEEIVADFNAQSPLPSGEEPSADTTHKIVCSSQGLAIHPQHAKPFVVWHQAAGSNAVDELGR